MPGPNHDPNLQERGPGSRQADMSEEDLKLINHLTWLYGGYRMRDRTYDMTYNESKIAKNVFRMRKHPALGPKRGPGRPRKGSFQSVSGSKSVKSRFSEGIKPNHGTRKSTANSAKPTEVDTTKKPTQPQDNGAPKKRGRPRLHPKAEEARPRKKPGRKPKAPNSTPGDSQPNSSREAGRTLEDLRYLLNRRMRVMADPKINDHRRPAWPAHFKLKDKIEFFIAKNIADITDFRAREPTTLSICDQFALQNHEAMVADSDRVHYYRAAIFWTGHASQANADSNENEHEMRIAMCTDSTLEDKKGLCEDYENLGNLGGLHSLLEEKFSDSLSCKSTEISYHNSVVNLRGLESNLGGFYASTTNATSTHTPTTVNSTTNSNIDNNSVKSNKEDEEGECAYYCHNKKILEIGTGPMCVLAMNAVKAGAKSVDALEVSVPASRLAGKLMAAYGFDNVIKVFNTHSKLFIFDQNEYFKDRSLKQLPKDHPLSSNSCQSNHVSKGDENCDGNTNDKADVDDNDNTNTDPNNYDTHEKEDSNPDSNPEHDNPNTENMNTNNFCNTSSNTYTNMDSTETMGSMDNTQNNTDNRDEGPELTLPPHPPYDMVISEILGDFASQEGVADVFLDFQRRILFENRRFMGMVKSIPYRASTMFVPSFFPDSSNILNKSCSDPEMTIFSPTRKMLQSVGMRIDNLPVCGEWLPLEEICLEEWMLPQMCQHRLNLFRVTSFGDLAGLLVGIDIEIRPGEHFGTRYGQCESWYTNLLLLDREYTVFENDLVLVSSVANLTNYVKVSCEVTKIQVSRPSYAFQVYILSPVRMNLPDHVLNSDLRLSTDFSDLLSPSRLSITDSTTGLDQCNNDNDQNAQVEEDSDHHHNHVDDSDQVKPEVVVDDQKASATDHDPEHDNPNTENTDNVDESEHEHTNHDLDAESKDTQRGRSPESVGDDDEFDLDALFPDFGKPGAAHSVRLECEALRGLAYDIPDRASVGYRSLNAHCPFPGTPCALPEPVLGAREFARVGGRRYKVLHRPPPVLIDYQEQTSTIYYETPCVRRKMHTDPPKRYHRIKIKPAT